MRVRAISMLAMALCLFGLGDTRTDAPASDAAPAAKTASHQGEAESLTEEVRRQVDKMIAVVEKKDAHPRGPACSREAHRRRAGGCL